MQKKNPNSKSPDVSKEQSFRRKTVEFQSSVIQELKRYGQFFSGGRNAKLNSQNFSKFSAQKNAGKTGNFNRHKSPSPVRNAQPNLKKTQFAPKITVIQKSPIVNKGSEKNKNAIQPPKMNSAPVTPIKKEEPKPQIPATLPPANKPPINVPSANKTPSGSPPVVKNPETAPQVMKKIESAPAGSAPQEPKKIDSLKTESAPQTPVTSNHPPPPPPPKTPQTLSDGDKLKVTKVKPNTTDSSKTIELPTPESVSFQKVTQELATIIKNFQKQIQEVPISKATMEQVPSSMIQPKKKQFFQNVTHESRIEIPKQTISKTGKSPLGSQSSLRTTSSRSIHSWRTFSHHVTMGLDPLKALKDEVQKAIQARKTFTVRGNYHAIRKALLSRGWVEKFHSTYKDQLSEELKRYQNYTISELLPLLRREDLTQMCKNTIKSKLLGGYQVDFYWGTNDEAFRENPDKIKLTLINKLKRDIFSYTNKQGLCEGSKFSYWYQKNNVSKLNHPRTYPLSKNGDVSGFINDFRLTAAMSVLKWIVRVNMTRECKLLSPFGKIPLETFDFALNECCKFIKKARHEDIDVAIPIATEHEWNQFLEFFYKLVHYNNHFKKEGKETEDSLVRKSNYILNNLRSFYPYVDMDGMMNIWILKPTASSRGRGIHMCRTLQYVLKVIREHHNVRYIIQKYIERPLLIYNTKFDIRQWFLISNCCPLTIWMYKECYLRFSSQTYNLRKLHESIHLTNNSVQSKYKTNTVDAALPYYNMWDSSEFQKYLSNIGYPDVYNKIIYPGMKQCLTAAVIMHQEKMVIRKNCFELYGADFMVTEDFQPWLIEINSNPALFPSTPITARMCPRVLEDVIKVVVDYAHNNKANTGLFELIYREQVTKLPQVTNLELKGTPLQNNYFFNGPEEIVRNDLKNYETPVDISNPTNSLKMFGDEMKKTLKNLLQIIHNEKQKRGLKE